MVGVSFQSGFAVRGLAAAPVLSPPKRFLKAAVVVVDAASIAAGLTLAFALRDHLPTDIASAPAVQHALLGALSLPVWLFVFSHYRLYRTRHVESRLQEFKRIVSAVGASVLGMTFLSTMLKLDVSRGWLVLSLPVTTMCVTASRGFLRRAFQCLRARGYLPRKVVIVGTNLEAVALRHMLDADPKLGYQVVGFLDCGGQQLSADLHIIPEADDIVSAVARTGATGVLVATTSIDLETANILARQLTDAGVHVELSSSLRDIAAERLTLRLLGRCPVVYVEPVRRRGWRTKAKRAFDMVFGLVALVVMLPVVLLAALAIKLDSRGPVLFRQQRVGLDGREFQLLKLRSMVSQAEKLRDGLLHMNEADGPLFKIQKDPRVTLVGSWLRRFSIDELPQLWNVIKGEMSLVGPRPAIPSEVERWDRILHQRVRVRPGMTGLWQVNGRSSSSFEDYARLDLYYVDNWSLWTDMAIIAKTIPVLLGRRGAC